MSGREKRFRDLFRGMPQGVIFLTIDGIIDEFNPSASRILGLSADQLQGRSIDEYPWEVLDEIGAKIEMTQLPVSSALHSGKKKELILGLSGHTLPATVWLNLLVNPVMDEETGKICGAYLIFDDVTSDIELRNSQEAANREAIVYFKRS